MPRKIHASQPVRDAFKGVDLQAVLRRLSTKLESCRSCGEPIGRNSPANLVSILNHEKRIKWPALIHPRCGDSAVYETSTAPAPNKIFFEVECALLVGERGPVPALAIDAYGGLAITEGGEVHDRLLAGFATLGFDFPDWVCHEGEDADPVDERNCTPGLAAIIEGAEVRLLHDGRELHRLGGLRYFPRWYRAASCGALVVMIGRNLQGMTFDSLEFIQRAARNKELVQAVAAVTRIPTTLEDRCYCVNGKARKFGSCCGSADGPEE